MVALAWGTIAILRDRALRSYSKDNPDVEDNLEENAWGFGQIIAVVLLLMPLFALFEVTYGKPATEIHDRVNETKVQSEAVKRYAKPPVLANLLPQVAQAISYDTQSQYQQQKPLQAYEGFYHCCWFRRLVLLLYLLLLNLGLDILFHFPWYSGSKYGLSKYAGSTLRPYIKWLGLDCGIAWFFIIIALHWPILDEYAFSRGGQTFGKQILLDLMLPNQHIDYFRYPDNTGGSKMWWMLVFIGVSASILFDFSTWNWVF